MHLRHGKTIPVNNSNISKDMTKREVLGLPAVPLQFRKSRRTNRKRKRNFTSKKGGQIKQAKLNQKISPLYPINSNAHLEDLLK